MALLAPQNVRLGAAQASSSRRTKAVCAAAKPSRNARKALHVVAEVNKRGPQPAAAQVPSDLHCYSRSSLAAGVATHNGSTTGVPASQPY